MNNPEKSLAFALEKYPDRIDLLPAQEILMEAARQNPKRSAYLKLAVPDEMVKSLRGKEQERDLILLVRVPKDILNREDSRIVLPGEVR